MTEDTFIHETTRTCDNAAYQIKPGDGHRLVLGMYTTETAAIAAAREIEREGTP
jgi:hypothetical protein